MGEEYRNVYNAILYNLPSITLQDLKTILNIDTAFAW